MVSFLTFGVVNSTASMQQLTLLPGRAGCPPHKSFSLILLGGLGGQDAHPTRVLAEFQHALNGSQCS
jgi:hypothetical protein